MLNRLALTTFFLMLKDEKDLFFPASLPRGKRGWGVLSMVLESRKA